MTPPYAPDRQVFVKKDGGGVLPAEAKALLRPYAGEMVAYAVDKAVGSPKNDRPELIEPLDAAPPA